MMYYSTSFTCRIYRNFKKVKVHISISDEHDIYIFQGWGVAVLVGVPHKDAEFKTHPIHFLNEKTLKGTFYGNYKPRTDIPAVVEQYMAGVCNL